MNAEISAAAVVLRAGAGGDDVRPGLPGVGDEALAAVDHPLAAVGAVVAFEPGRRARAAGVRAGAGLGQPVRADDLAAGHRDEVAVLLLLRAGEVQRAAAQRGVGGDDEPERAPHPRDLLDRDGVGERVHAGAALVLGDRDAEPAHLAQPADDLDREAVLSLVLLDDRRDLVLHEVADRRPEQLVLRREVQVHRPEPTSRPRARPCPWRDVTRRVSCYRRAMPEPAHLAGQQTGAAAVAPPSGRAGESSTSASTLRRAILIHLRQAGPSSPDVLAAALEASRTGVLQQLHALEAAGLVSHAAEKHGSAGRATSTTSHRTRRACSRPTTAASRRASSRPSRPWAATTSSSRCSPHDAARSATGCADA